MLIVLALLAILCSGVDAFFPLLINTTYGTVQGVQFTNTYPSSLFLGIPYATAPVGILRFAPPLPPPVWDGIRDASAYGAACPQSTDPLDKTTSEDCLFLNVYVPANANLQSRLPVMFFIHGGSYTSGSGSWLVYQSSGMAVRNNVVAVTINYRLGSLGGLYTGADTILGNFQLRDQRLAMQWVQQNIASFGGDPTRVTIYGESAGAYSVMTHLVSPRSFGLFKSVIAESAPFGIEAESPKSGQELATLYLAKLGCPPLTNASHVACLRSQSVGALVAADNVALVKRGVAMPMEWTPVVDNDQLPYQILEGILMKKVAPGTSVIIGTNTNEFDLFVDTQYPNPMNYSSLITELTTFFNASIAATLITMYNPSPSSPDLRETFSAIQTDYFMGCPSRYAVRNLNISYLYQYRHVNSFNWLLSLFGAMPSQCVAKACHSAELYLLFNPFYVLWNIIRPTAGEESLSSQMETYWTNLATSGNPNFPVRPNVTWNQGAQASMLYLDDPISMGPNFDSAQCDFFDSIGYNRR